MNEKPHLPSFIVLKLYIPKQNRKSTVQLPAQTAKIKYRQMRSWE